MVYANKRGTNKMEVQTIQTSYGELIPKYSELDQRSRDRKSVIKYPSGSMKSIYLEGLQTVNTKFGILQAEMVTFYENQTLHRVFPTYGKLSGFWSEEEEKKLVPITTIQIGSMVIQAQISGFCFYPEGNIKSITLYPGEQILINSPFFEGMVKNGIKFFEDGQIQSLEPATPKQVEVDGTTYFAYDPTAVGISGEHGSLKFFANGSIHSLISNQTGVKIVTKDKEHRIKPEMILSYYDPTEKVMGIIRYEFAKDTLTIVDSKGITHQFNRSSILSIETFQIELTHQASCTDCSSCSGDCAS